MYVDWCLVFVAVIDLFSFTQTTIHVPILFVYHLSVPQKEFDIFWHCYQVKVHAENLCFSSENWEFILNKNSLQMGERFPQWH